MLQPARYLLCAIYGIIAIAALARNRRHILPTLTAPFRKTHGTADDIAGPELSGASDVGGERLDLRPRLVAHAGPATGTLLSTQPALHGDVQTEATAVTEAGQRLTRP